MTLLYIIIGVLALMATRNIIAVRRSAKEYANILARKPDQQSEKTI